METMQPRPPAGPREQLAERPAPAPPVRAQSQPNDPLAELLPALVGTLFGVVVLAAFGLFIGGQVGGVAALGAALLGPHSAWYLSRASAFAAYLLLWLSMSLGISVTNRLARVWPGGPTATDLHEYASLLGIVFALLHGLVLLGDSYIGYTLPQVLVPFAGSYLPLWVGLGQVGLYLMALVTVSFYLRQRIGARAWRLLHYLSYAAFALSLAHGLASGTDSSAAWAIWIYLSTGASVLLLTIYRVWVGWRGVSPPVPRLA